MVLRTKEGKRPFYVSPGHLISLEECRDIVLGCVRRYRMPIPLRQADLLSRRLRASASGEAGNSGET
jgi:deoxyribonuclease V